MLGLTGHLRPTRRDSRDSESGLQRGLRLSLGFLQYGPHPLQGAVAGANAAVEQGLQSYGVVVAEEAFNVDAVASSFGNVINDVYIVVEAR